MALEQVNNGDKGKVARDKINASIVEADKVVGKMNKVPTANAGNNAVFDADGQVVVGAVGSDDKVRISATDTTNDYLNPKINAINGLTSSIINPAANEQVQLELDVNSLTPKATPVNADELILSDSADSNSIKKITWSNLVASISSASCPIIIISEQGVGLDASKPVTGLTIGDSYVSTDTFLLYTALTSTTWNTGTALIDKQPIVDYTSDNNDIYIYDKVKNLVYKISDIDLLPLTPEVNTLSFSAAPSFDVDDSYSAVIEMPLTANTVPSLTNEVNGGTYIFTFVTNATGGYSITPDSSFGTKSDNSIDAVTSATAHAIYIYTVVVRPSGSKFYTIESIGN